MENLLHYIWKFRLFDKQLYTTDNKLVEIIDTGMANHDEGPDFFNAKVKIDNTVWAGNIEIHTSSKDWYKHQHHINPKYDSVILHIVENINGEIYNTENRLIPQCKITYPKHIKENFDYLLHADQYLPCCNFISAIPKFEITSWLNNLILERLESKTSKIKDLLKQYKNSWGDIFYIILCRNFGFGLNADAFEQLALSLPLKYILKEKNDIVKIESLLFGQAEILNQNINDEYFNKLKNEYTFLQKKYELKPLASINLKNSRVRPYSFPQLRLAQFAAMLYDADHLLSKILACSDIGKLKLILQINASEYWQTHYNLGTISPKKSKFIGESSIDVIIINTVVPILFMYGKLNSSNEHCDRAISFLEQLNPEKNSIINEFSQYGISITNALESQAIIQLKKEYCLKKKCIFCRMGYSILKKENLSHRISGK